MQAGDLYSLLINILHEWRFCFQGMEKVNPSEARMKTTVPFALVRSQKDKNGVSKSVVEYWGFPLLSNVQIEYIPINSIVLATVSANHSGFVGFLYI